MIGATLGAVDRHRDRLRHRRADRARCVIFYVAYQQFENYVIYPRVMSRTVDLPGSLTVIAALVGASLLGVVGALLAIPTAAAIPLLVKEVLLPAGTARLEAPPSVRVARWCRRSPSGRPTAAAAVRRPPGATRRDDHVEHLLGVADPQVLGARRRRPPRPAARREPLAGLRRLQVVVVLGHQRRQRLAGLAPRRRGRSAVARSAAAGDSSTAPSHGRVVAVISARSVPNDQPTSQSRAGRGTRRTRSPPPRRTAPPPPSSNVPSLVPCSLGCRGC